MSNRLPIALSSALAIALAVVAGPVAALGLGQIQVKSRPGQPLLAEIPIISSDPSELQGLQVQLASPETFSRVGLEPPQGLVSSLRFEPALDTRGRPVIRVTSATPVQQPLLTFLLEVDWGQGRLVREYSALLDTPRTVAAPLQPSIQAPTVAPPNMIVRPAIAPVAAPVADAPPPLAPAPAPVVVQAPPVPTAIPLPAPVASPPPPAAVASAPTAVPARSNEYGPVRPGQTLGEIASSLDHVQGYSAAQTMLALLRANPDAFIDGNINRLKRGAVLRVPPAAELAHYNASEAAAVVHEQIAQWRGAQRPQPQPAAVAATSKAPAAHTNDAVTKAAARTADARLEIVPTSSGRGQKAGTRSGIETGGEGEMLRQQLQETKETLVARDAEVNELKTRVAELEKLQQQQQQLITLKDSALAAAQQNLAASNRKATIPAVAATTTQVRQPTMAQPQERSSGFWLWGGLVLVLAALVAWLLARRRGRDVAPKRVFDAALAASIPAGMQEQAPVETAPSTDTPLDVQHQVHEPQPLASAQWNSMPATGVVAPTWHGRAGLTEPATTIASPGDAGQRLELARSYLDLGDDDAARALLREVLEGRDPDARETAARMLRDL